MNKEVVSLIASLAFAGVSIVNLYMRNELDRNQAKAIEVRDLEIYSLELQVKGLDERLTEKIARLTECESAQGAREYTLANVCMKKLDEAEAKEKDCWDVVGQCSAADWAKCRDKNRSER